MVLWTAIAVLAALSAAAGSNGHRRRRKARAPSYCDFDGSTEVTTVEAFYLERPDLLVQGDMHVWLRTGGCENVSVKVLGQRNVLQNFSIDDTSETVLAVRSESQCSTAVGVTVSMCMPNAPSGVEVSQATVWGDAVQGNITAEDGAFVYFSAQSASSVYLHAERRATISTNSLDKEVHTVNATAVDTSQILIGGGDAPIRADLFVDNSFGSVKAPVSNLTVSLHAGSTVTCPLLDWAFLKGDEKSNVVLDNVTTEIVRCTKIDLTYAGTAKVVKPKAAKKYKECRDIAAESASTEAAPMDVAV